MVRVPRFPSVLVGLLLVLATPAAAQDFPARAGVIASDVSVLDERAVAAAADGLQEQDIDVLVLFLEGSVGDSLAEAEAYLDAALEHYGLGEEEPYLVLFIGTRPLTRSDGERPLFLAYGEDLVAPLERSVGGTTVADRIRTDTIIPLLLDGEFTAAVVAGLEAAARALVPAEPPPAEPIREPTSGRSGISWLWLVLIAVVAGGGWFLWRRQGTARALRAARAELAQVKGPLSQLLIDLAGSDDRQAGPDPFLPEDPGKSTDLVLIRSLLAGERTELLTGLERDYAEAIGRLRQTEESFGALRRQEETAATAEALEALLPEYRSLLEGAEGLKAFSDRLSATWTELKAEADRLPDAIAAFEGRIEALAERLRASRTADWPEVEELTAPFSEGLAAVRAAMAEQAHFRGLRLLAEGEARMSLLDHTLEGLDAFATSRDGLRRQLEARELEGHRVGHLRTRLDEVLQKHVAVVADLGRFDEAMAAAAADLNGELETVARDLEAIVARHRENASSLEELGRAGEKARATIESGIEAFAAIQEFAPASWRDIRGNGSEAQKAAERAFAKYAEAQEANRLGHDAQDLDAARRAIEAAFGELEQVELLIGAIRDRLATLREARATAREQYRLVAEELERQRSYLARPEVDRDVGEEAELDLQKASAGLERVTRELDAEQPNWLAVMAAVQEADRSVEQAVARIRGDQEAMAQRRRRLASEIQEAEAALQRIRQFSKIHRSDLGSGVAAALAKAETAMKTGRRLEGSLATLEEGALGAALDEAAEAFDRAQQQADQAYALAEAEFQAMERLRSEASSAVAETEAALASLEGYLGRSKVLSGRRELLDEMRSSLPVYDPTSGRDVLEGILVLLQALTPRIETLRGEVDREVAARESELRRRRLEQLEQARRQRARDAAGGSGWGGWSAGSGGVKSSHGGGGGFHPSGGARSGGGGKTGGGWGGGGKKSGGGW